MDQLPRSDHPPHPTWSPSNAAARRVAPIALLDAAIAGANALRLGPMRLSPYLLAMDAGIVASTVAVFVHPARAPHVRPARFAVVFLATLALYEALFLRLKRRVTGSASRSALQDALLFVLPCAGAGFALAGLPLGASFDLLGLILPLLLGFTRIGCFLGGCCFGLPVPWGVAYPRAVFAPRRDGCRPYSPGVDPRTRVLPLQLAEALVHFTAFAALSALARRGLVPPGRTLPVFLVGYATWRCVSDAARTASARPRVGPFSEAQLVAASIVLVGTLGLWVWR